MSGQAFPIGKLPPKYLEQLIDQLTTEDSDLVLGPGIGLDCAVLDIGDIYLVVKSDPITFTQKDIGWYCVNVNANDIATTGAEPKWFMVTMLLPQERTTMDLIDHIASQIRTVCDQLGIVVIGGHTEITQAVTRPLVCGSMIGTVSKTGLKQKERIESGDTIVMTKTAGNEGTAIIAREFPELLSENGVSGETIGTAAGFLERLSVIPEARIGASNPSVRAMHDVTEGGVATAIFEISAAGGRGIDVILDKILVDPITDHLCRVCGLDPLGLIGSGSLLTVIGTDAVDDYLGALGGAGIQAAVIGRVTSREAGVRATLQGKPVVLPRFEADEIVRMFGL